MDHPVVALHCDRNAGGSQTLAVLLPLVAQRVVLGGDDESWREPAQVRLQERRHQRVELVVLGGDVVVHEPLLGLAGDVAVLSGELGDRVVGTPEVEIWIDNSWNPTCGCFAARAFSATTAASTARSAQSSLGLGFCRSSTATS